MRRNYDWNMRVQPETTIPWINKRRLGRICFLLEKVTHKCFYFAGSYYPLRFVEGLMPSFQMLVWAKGSKLLWIFQQNRNPMFDSSILPTLINSPKRVSILNNQLPSRVSFLTLSKLAVSILTSQPTIEPYLCSTGRWYFLRIIFAFRSLY